MGNWQSGRDIACGCFDEFGYSRKSLFLFFKDLRDKLQRYTKKHNTTEGFSYTFPDDDWTLTEKYALEVAIMLDVPSLPNPIKKPARKSTAKTGTRIIKNTPKMLADRKIKMPQTSMRK